MLSRNAFFASCCLLCNGYVRGLKPLCAGCESDFPWNQFACLRCAMPMPASAGLRICGACLQSPPLFEHACCAWVYDDPVAGLLNRYKHSGQLACGYWLAQGLADAVAAHYLQQKITLPDCLLPVPLHWKRLRNRGFDQALEIAKVLSGRLDLPVSRSLQRQRFTDSQQSLDREQRQRNLAGAFALRKPLKSQCVALVDDVLTTGSTANEITALLLSAGVDEVHLWAIARTP